MHGIRLGEPSDLIMLVLIYTLDQITGYTDIQRTVPLAGQNVVQGRFSIFRGIDLALVLVSQGTAVVLYTSKAAGFPLSRE